MTWSWRTCTNILGRTFGVFLSSQGLQPTARLWRAVDEYDNDQGTGTRIEPMLQRLESAGVQAVTEKLQRKREREVMAQDVSSVEPDPLFYEETATLSFRNVGFSITIRDQRSLTNKVRHNLVHSRSAAHDEYNTHSLMTKR